jgi:hypothetical protein
MSWPDHNRVIRKMRSVKEICAGMHTQAVANVIAGEGVNSAVHPQTVRPDMDDSPAPSECDAPLATPSRT